MQCPSRPTLGPWGLLGPNFRELLLERRHGRGRQRDRWEEGSNNRGWIMFHHFSGTEFMQITTRHVTNKVCTFEIT